MSDMILNLQNIHYLQSQLMVKEFKNSLEKAKTLFSKRKVITLIDGSVAQWIRRLPTEQEILGSSPGRVKTFFDLLWSHF